MTSLIGNVHQWRHLLETFVDDVIYWKRSLTMSFINDVHRWRHSSKTFLDDVTQRWRHSSETFLDDVIHRKISPIFPQFVTSFVHQFWWIFCLGGCGTWRYVVDRPRAPTLTSHRQTSGTTCLWSARNLHPSTEKSGQVSPLILIH